MIDVESYIMFLTACFFTLLYFLPRRRPPVMGIFGGISWFVLGILWLFLAFEAPSYSTYSVGFLFNGFGIMMIIFVMVDLLSLGKNTRLLGDDLEDYS